MIHRTRPVRGRFGYTLVEIAIVLAIMTALATASWPMLMKPWQRSIVQRDAAMLREAMQNARLTAISNGHSYQLRWKLGKNEFEIQSRDRIIPEIPRENDSEQFSPTFANQQPQSSPMAAESNAMFEESTSPRMNHDVLVKQRLADGVVFDSELAITDDPHGITDLLAGDASEFLNSDSTTEASGLSSEQAFRGQQNRAIPDRWSDPIVFHPSGRAENREITLHSEDGYSITLSLRGFTGAATIGPPVKTPKPGTDEQ